MGRLTLSVFTLLALWLEPTEPQQYARFARSLVAGYVLYSMVTHPPKTAPSPMLYLGFLFAALGAGMVLYFKPAS